MPTATLAPPRKRVDQYLTRCGSTVGPRRRRIGFAAASTALPCSVAGCALACQQLSGFHAIPGPRAHCSTLTVPPCPPPQPLRLSPPPPSRRYTLKSFSISWPLPPPIPLVPPLCSPATLPPPCACNERVQAHRRREEEPSLVGGQRPEPAAADSTNTRRRRFCGYVTSTQRFYPKWGFGSPGGCGAARSCPVAGPCCANTRRRPSRSHSAS